MRAKNRDVYIPQKTVSERIKAMDGAPASTGKTNLRKYLSGGILTRNQAILAKCCDCMGYFFDGRWDCKIPACPLYPFMPYRGREEK